MATELASLLLSQVPSNFSACLTLSHLAPLKARKSTGLVCAITTKVGQKHIATTKAHLCHRCPNLPVFPLRFHEGKSLCDAK